MLLEIVGIIVLVGAVWLFGSGVARAAGILLVVLGLLMLATGSVFGVVVGVGGVLIWLGGHWFFAYKYHGWRSPLAQRAFNSRFLRRIDPTRNWGIRTFDDG